MPWYTLLAYNIQYTNIIVCIVHDLAHKRLEPFPYWNQFTSFTKSKIYFVKIKMRTMCNANVSNCTRKWTSDFLLLKFSGLCLGAAISKTFLQGNLSINITYPLYIHKIKNKNYYILQYSTVQCHATLANRDSRLKWTLCSGPTH